jgi:hypothetical protein
MGKFGHVSQEAGEWQGCFFICIVSSSQCYVCYEIDDASLNKLINKQTVVIHKVAFLGEFNLVSQICGLLFFFVLQPPNYQSL